jgi:hypothetical protein
MKQLCRIGILVVAIVVLFSSLATSAEEDVLRALERVKASIEDEVPYKKVAELLDEAKIQVDTIRIGETTNCFRVAVKRCYYWYHLGIKSWQTLIKNQEQRDIHAKRAKSEYWDDNTKTVSLKMVENYDKLITHAQETLPSKWEYGNAALDEARDCLEKQR